MGSGLVEGGLLCLVRCLGFGVGGWAGSNGTGIQNAFKWTVRNGGQKHRHCHRVSPSQVWCQDMDGANARHEPFKSDPSSSAEVRSRVAALMGRGQVEPRIANELHLCLQ